jgi:hypothetical protein
MTTTRTHFTFRVDMWTPDGESIVEHVAGVEDYQVALVTYRAAVERWPGTPITLRQWCASDRGQSAPARGVAEGVLHLLNCVQMISSKAAYSLNAQIAAGYALTLRLRHLWYLVTGTE